MTSSASPFPFFDHSRHKLTVRNVDAVLDVLAFEGTEGLSELFNYRVEFTSTARDVAVEKMLGQNATFSLYSAPQQSPMRGFIQPPA
ncbi:uncharacterized protein involved in type VI secretion and phage assembly, partial [Pseudomonas sp. BIGb0450]|nr:uncharacterized protein involved in type VI secretion and phage assembly [Pseudomonas sp. BIGb0558]MCS3440807.1 uncharacterized protein involved in type VI secretion and phage assembly [Pseudomonas sp. BIGb0450]